MVAKPAPVMPPSQNPTIRLQPWMTGMAVCGLTLAGIVAYRNCFSVPFLFDDAPSILYNPTIRHLWPPWEMLSPPSTGEAVTSRPVANASLALNYALEGSNVSGYHAFNLAVHISASVLLFGIVRRTLLQPRLSETYGHAATPLAWLSSLLWLVHPLLTEPVIYIVGRTEVMMGFFYLSTLYAAIRAMGSLRPALWMAVSVLSCVVGMATKEVMVSAPLMVLLYDRTFVAGTFRDSFRLRRAFYGFLSLSWVLLLFLVFGAGWASRGGSTGYGGDIAWWQYLATQFYAITRYLWLSVWPHPLIFDYGRFIAKDPYVIGPCFLLLLGIGAATVRALWNGSGLGFVGSWFFAILAPSSSVLPIITQTMAERRMYLALPAVIVPLVLLLYRCLGRWYLPAGVLVAIVLMAATSARSLDYRSARSIWQDTVDKWPTEARPHLNLGLAFMSEPAVPTEAIRQFEDVIRIMPDLEMAYSCLGSALGLLPGRESEAIAAYEQAERVGPNAADIENNLAGLLLRAGRQSEAIDHYRRALRLSPGSAVAHCNLAIALAGAGRLEEAIDEYKEAIAIDPQSADPRCDLGLAFAMSGRLPEAIQQYEEAIRLNPGLYEAHLNLGKALLSLGRRTEAQVQFAAAANISAIHR
jgi:tetratricopeptide (TPR) repeat protein